MLFSERIGVKPVKIFQKDSMDPDLRRELWNVLYEAAWGSGHYIYIGERQERDIWCNYLKRRVDEYRKPNTQYWAGPYKQAIWEGIKDDITKYFFKCPWNEVYDLIEHVANLPDMEAYKREKFISECSRVLEKEMSAYRFVGSTISPITSDQEIAEVEQALQTPMREVAAHINRALELLSDRQKPDYPNSIKDSIHAIECQAKYLLGDESIKLGTALQSLAKRFGIHPKLEQSFHDLYDFTSDSGGIRHAKKPKKDFDPGFEEAKYFLVSCAAFVNYLTAKAEKAGMSFR